MASNLIQADTETSPAMEVHLGEVVTAGPALDRSRRCIIWLNGKRWEGDLAEGSPGT
jgi:hypothetical protein